MYKYVYVITMNIDSKVCLSRYSIATFSNIINKISTSNHLTLFIWFNKLKTICFLLYYHINFIQKCFSDLLICDFINKRFRFYSIYNLLSFVYTQRVLLNVMIPMSFFLDSITVIYPNASWYERECWDLYGVVYSNHRDLRRLLNDYGFVGFPLRKDFPLSGFLEVKFDFIFREISYEQVNLVQEFRFFKKKTNWDFFH